MIRTNMAAEVHSKINQFTHTRGVWELYARACARTGLFFVRFDHRTTKPKLPPDVFIVRAKHTHKYEPIKRASKKGVL